MAPEVGRWIEGGGVLVEGSAVVEVLEADEVGAEQGRRTVETLDYGDAVLLPGLVNAHAHLELGWARGQLPPGAGFARWVGELLQKRIALGGEAAELEERSVRAGLHRAARTGTTLVGDIDASDAQGRVRSRPDATPGAWPRVVRLREVLDGGDAARSDRAFGRVEQAPAPAPRQQEGLSPHAPFTVSADLLRRCAALAGSRDLAVQVHWAESEDERAWLLRGEGPFARVLGASPRRSGLDLLEETGLLGPRTSLVHANLPEPGDHERIARAGAAVVHCPGTHAFFGRDPFDWDAWERAGVPVALGTDSLASNEDLDLRRELALAWEAAPGCDPMRLLEAATRGGARALGLDASAGRIGAGRPADLVAFALNEELCAGGRSSLAAHLVGGRPELRGVVLAGRPLEPEGAESTDEP